MSEANEDTGRKSRAEWVELMAAHEAGDLSQREFCKVQDVPYSSFCYWRQQLSLATRSESAALVELPAAFGAIGG